MREITDEQQLREIVAEPPKVIKEKAVGRIDRESARFIASSPFFLLATSGPDGVDVSPRGDPPGSVLVLDDGAAVAFGDRKGNHRLDSLRNILHQPQVGMLFLVPGANDTLRLNGRARIVADPPWADRLEVSGSRPELAVVVEVDELFLHCAKAFLRSSLWKPESWPERRSVPSAGRIVKGQRSVPVPAAVIDAALRAEARRNQY